MLVTLLTSAMAAPASTHTCSNPAKWEYGTDACACVRAGEPSSSWWSGVDTKLKPEDRPVGTCFGFAYVMSSVSGSSVFSSISKTLEKKADTFAWNNDAYWLNGTPEMIILHEETETISNPPDDLSPMPEGPGMWSLLDTLTDQPFARIATPLQIVLAQRADLDDDGHDDVVVYLADDAIWTAYGPLDPNDPVTPPL